MNLSFKTLEIAVCDTITPIDYLFFTDYDQTVMFLAKKDGKESMGYFDEADINMILSLVVGIVCK